MIHYHGADMYPVQKLASLVAERHAFVSFFYPAQVELVAATAHSFALDNGAYSAWTKGLTYDFDGYAEWIGKWHKHPGFDFCLVPDKIDGDTQDNLRLMAEWSKRFSAAISCPVWHLHESLDHLLFLTKQYHRVAFGSSGNYAQIGTPKWWTRMAEAFNHICDEQGRPPCKIHGLRMLDPEIVRRFPFSSCDSTSLARHQNDASRIYQSRSPEMNGVIIRHNIERQLPPPVWQPIPTQQGLF